MKKTISFLILAIILCSMPKYANAQNKFISPKKYNEMEWSFGFSHMIAHVEGCTKGWAWWLGVLNFELGCGFDLGDYGSTTIEDWSTAPHGESYTRYTTEDVMSGTEFSLYLGYFLNTYLSVGGFMDLKYGHHKLNTKYRHYGYGISTDIDFWESDFEHPFSLGLYVKGSYRLWNYIDIFLMGQLAFNGDNGLSIGTTINF